MYSSLIPLYPEFSIRDGLEFGQPKAMQSPAMTIASYRDYRMRVTGFMVVTADKPGLNILKKMCKIFINY
ncbi:MAG TPA: hypothetical protein VG738_14315 [Chitinophagaceae bacterium]|nr:hypothetical protein [Chitinophagaceae bacterium]